MTISLLDNYQVAQRDHSPTILKIPKEELDTLISTLQNRSEAFSKEKGIPPSLIQLRRIKVNDYYAKCLKFYTNS